MGKRIWITNETTHEIKTILKDELIPERLDKRQKTNID